MIELNCTVCTIIVLAESEGGDTKTTVEGTIFTLVTVLRAQDKSLDDAG